MTVPRSRLNLFQASFIRHHAMLGRDAIWIADQLAKCGGMQPSVYDVTLAAFDVTLEALRMSVEAENDHQRASKSDAKAVRPLPGEADAKPPPA